MPRHNPYDNPDLQRLLKKIEQNRQAGINRTRTYKRGLPIVPEMVGHVLEIHNGKTFVRKEIIQAMVSEKKKLGEYSETRRFSGHGKAQGRH